MRKFILFGIDLQNDFCKEGGALYVPGASVDMDRVLDLLETHINDIADVVMTLDTHEVDHIGHPGWWALADGSEPAPFTPVTLDMLETGVIRARDPKNQNHALEYVGRLCEEHGTVMIWPVHCVPGTEGYEAVMEVEWAVVAWEVQAQSKATWIKKGFEKNVESFGVFKPEYNSKGQFLEFNTHLFESLYYRNLPIVVVGEAMSHCVKRSIEQLLEHATWERKPVEVIIVRDCMSNVPGFEAAGEEFLEYAKQNGCVVCTAAELPTVLG